jgi:dipeptidyl aminopeptidase/acylaminoacyl peptidase
MMAGWLGDPDTEADFLLSRSPITYADDIRAPLFVIQGANDPRVVKDESDQIVDKLRGRGVDVRYDVYPDEGHGFTKTHKRNQSDETRPTSSSLTWANHARRSRCATTSRRRPTRRATRAR